MKDELNCIGCNACYNICPNNAITMSHNKYGFLQPLINKNRCINCGLCKKICLAKDNIFFQNPKSTYIIQSKNKSYIEKSSSGGMFAELAKYVISKNGVVFGCAMERIDDGFDVKHIYIEDEKDLYKLQGSKYVQSRIGNTIKEAKEFLDQGRFVLYSGTPCQIAGLKAYLKQDYENLLTVDLSCTGTPSLEIFNSFIKFLEKKFGQKIIKFEFRNKEHMGWSCGNALISFENGKQKILYNNVTSYLYLFINKKLQNKNCQECKYIGLERISDITVADAWGIEKEYPELLKSKFDKNRGISLVLVNTDKAKLVIKQLSENIFIKNIDINRLRKYNNPLTSSQNNIFDDTYLAEYKKFGYKGIEDLFKQKLGKKYYYYIVKNYTPKFIKNIIKLFLTQKVDCLLITAHGWPNYGSMLAAYSLQKAITKLGYSVKLINYMISVGVFKKFAQQYFKLTKLCVDRKDFYNLNKLSNTFILGSDNLINLNTCSFPFVARNLLNFTTNDKKRLMISGSIGAWDGLTQNKQEHNYIKYLLDRFDYISTREEHGKQVFEKEYNVQADWINDPVFYLKKDDFIELTKNIKEDYSNKIMQYILYPTSETKKIIEYTKKSMGLDIIKFDGNENVKYFSNNKNKSVENWLKAILESKLVITDSFHCVAFCLIFNKDFVCIKNTHATVRFLSLFKRLGIQIPLIDTVKDLQSADLSYNKDVVNKSLNDIREFALAKIQEYLLKPNKITIPNPEMEEYNRAFIKNNEVWYKRNRLFYFGIIVPFVIPIKRLCADIKNG